MLSHQRPKDDPVALTRSEVLAQATRLVDEGGLDALSMRRLAAALGVTPMALYNHVADREDLTVGIVDHVLDQLAVPEPTLGWEVRLTQVFTGLRQLYLRHPNVLPLVQTSRTPTAAQRRPLDVALQALEDAGASRGAALEAWSVLVGLTNGHVTYQVQGHLDGPPGTELPPVDFDHAFTVGLQALIAGVRERLVGATPRRA